MSEEKDTRKEIERLRDENRKLKEQVNNLKTENKKIKSKNRTLNEAWKKSEIFVRDITEGRSVLEIIKDVNNGGKLKKFESKCSQCNSDNINILKYNDFRIIICQSCKFKERIDGLEDEPT